MPTLTLPAGALRAAVDTARAAVEARNTIPILSTVRLSTDGGRLTVVGTNLDQVVERSVPVEDGSLPAVCVAAAPLAAALAKLATDGTADLSLQEDDSRLELRCGRARFRFPTAPAADFPVPAPTSWDAEWEMAGSDLAALLWTVRPAVSTEETRYYLNGVLLERADAELIATATDGHRMISRRVAAPDGAELPEGSSGSLIVPRAALSAIEGLAKEARVTVRLSGVAIRVEAGETTLTSKLVDGTFPDWRRVLPGEATARATCDRAALIAGVERVATIASERTRAVRVEVGAGHLTLTVTSPEHGTATEEVPCSEVGPALTIGFNARYLTDLLGRLSGEAATLWATDAGSACRWSGSDESDAAATLVLMPLRV